MPVTPTPGRMLGRRDALRRGGLLAAMAGAGPSILSACAGEATSATTPKVGNKVGGSLNYLSWEGYDLTGSKLMQRWQKDKGVSLNPTYISTSDDIQAKLKSGS